VKVRAWLITISLSLGFVTTLGSLLMAGEQKKQASPKTREEFRAIFERGDLPENFKGQFLDTQRLKTHVVFSMMYCHLIESTAALKFSGGSGKNEYLKEVETTRLCAEEAVTAVKPKFKKAQAELSKRPSAVEKLKSYTAAYLSIMGRIPRAELNTRVLDMLQNQDEKIVKDREAELDVELL
jgi:hypothetical protein